VYLKIRKSKTKKKKKKSEEKNHRKKSKKNLDENGGMIHKRKNDSLSQRNYSSFQLKIDVFFSLLVYVDFFRYFPNYCKISSFFSPCVPPNGRLDKMVSLRRVSPKADANSRYRSLWVLMLGLACPQSTGVVLFVLDRVRSGGVLVAVQKWVIMYHSIRK